MICPFRAKIKFYLFGIAARPTEKLAAQIILFAFQTFSFQQTIFYSMSFKRLLSIQCTSSAFTIEI
jgi:hypothetical protein